MEFTQKYIKKPINLFLSTFKNKKLGLILLIDVIFYFIFYIGFGIYAYYAKKIMKTLQNLNLNTIQNLNNINMESATQLLSQLQVFIASIIVATLLFILFIIMLLTLIKGFEWSKIVNKKLETFDYIRLLMLNILWFIIWIIIFFIPFSFIEKQAYITHVYYIFPPILYFTLFLQMSYAEKKSIWQALKGPITEGILKIYKYVSAIVIIVLFFDIPFMILKVLKLQPRIHLAIFSIILLIVLVIYKLYFYVTYSQAE